MRTQVCIIGGGPSGLLLGQLLYRAGIETVVLERQTHAHVLSRIRAGVLEAGTVETLTRAGVGDRLAREGYVHGGTQIAVGPDLFGIDLQGHTGKPVVVYGQTEITTDLYAAREATGGPVLFEVSDVEIHGTDGARPYVSFFHEGTSRRIDCDYVAGCDGFHGVSRKTIPKGVRQEFEKVYPFGWLGVLSETPPVDHELIYANSARGFALCSMRNANLSRYYIQCPLMDRTDGWSDDAFWDELRRRLPEQVADRLVTGPSIEKSIAPLRSFVSAPMRWGRLFLCGDAAHIVPPTGAKGLNAAVADVHYLSEALTQWYKEGSAAGLDGYSDRALARVWSVARFSWWMTMLLHRFPERGAFEQHMQDAELASLRDSAAVQRVLAENYVGLPY